MDKFVIRGGPPLLGSSVVRPSKNALLPCLASSLLTDEVVTFSDTSNHADIATMLKLLGHLGAKIEGTPGGPVNVRINNGGALLEAPYDLVRKMRAGVLVLGPLLARYGRARVSLPGGCAIGTRPIDQHLKGLEALGADILLEHGYVIAQADRLKGAEVIFEKTTVGGTQNLMMAASLAEGTTLLRNAAREPEIVNLAELLTSMGAHIEGAGTSSISIEGVVSLHGATHESIPDRIVAGTLLIAGAVTGGRVTCSPVIPEHLEVLIVKLREMGCEVVAEGDSVTVSSSGELKSADIETMPYPGFPTDLQAQFMTLLTQTRGTSTIKESIFENRFMHVQEIRRMGADVKVDGRMAVISGPTPLAGAPVMASDLRGAASLVLAGLCASGTTEVRRVYHLDRGYERFEERLSALGGVVKRVRE